jgi:hypothetical protein
MPSSNGSGDIYAIGEDSVLIIDHCQRTDQWAELDPLSGLGLVVARSRVSLDNLPSTQVRLFARGRGRLTF